jgi:Zn-dependent protease
MFGWSINLFRIRGIQLALHWSFFGILAWRTWEGWQESGWLGAKIWAVFTVLFFVCIVLHELGHSFTGMHFGFKVRRILLTPLGGMAEFNAIPRNPTQELLMTIAGPAVNFAIAGLLWGLELARPGWFADAEGILRAEVLSSLLYANIVVGLFNLLPVFPMDGGRIFRALMAYKFPYLKATTIASVVGKVMAGLLAVGYLLWSFLSDSRIQSVDLLVAAMLFGFIFRMNDLEYRAVKRAAEEEAYWKEIALRHARAVPPPSEPPVLG